MYRIALYLMNFNSDFESKHLKIVIPRFVFWGMFTTKILYISLKNIKITWYIQYFFNLEKFVILILAFQNENFVNFYWYLYLKWT